MATSCSPRCSLTTLQDKQTNLPSVFEVTVDRNCFFFFSLICATRTCNQCKYIKCVWQQEACMWRPFKSAEITERIVWQITKVKPLNAYEQRFSALRWNCLCVTVSTSWYVNFFCRSQNIWEMKINKGSSSQCAFGGGDQILAIRRKSFYSGCHGNGGKERK